MFLRFFKLYAYLITRRATNTNENYQQRIHATWKMLRFIENKAKLTSIISMVDTCCPLKKGFTNTYHELREGLLNFDGSKDEFFGGFKMFCDFMVGKYVKKLGTMGLIEENVLGELLQDSVPHPHVFKRVSGIDSSSALFGGEEAGLCSEDFGEELSVLGNSK